MLDSTSQGIIHLSAQVNNPNGIFISDTLNWTEISGSFIATGGENFITIGNFKDTSIIHGSGYYYIDDVCLSPDSLTCPSTVGINELNINNKLNLFPNPFTGIINITSQTNEALEINMFDITSRKLLNQQFARSTIIRTEHLPKGIYFYEVSGKKGVIKKGKLVKD